MSDLRADLPRCPEHGLAVGPDGQCILCKRRQRLRPRREVPWHQIALGLIADGGLGLLGMCVLAPTSRPRAGGPSRAAGVGSAVDAGRPVALPRPAGQSPEALSSQSETPAAQPDAGPPPREITARRLRRRRRRRRRQAKPPPQQAPDSDSEQEALAARARMEREYQRLALRQAMEQVSIRVYVTSWCPACRAARRWISENRVPARLIDVERVAGAARRLRAINPRGSIPTWDIDGQILVGFSPGAVGRAIEQAAARRAQ